MRTNFLLDENHTLRHYYTATGEYLTHCPWKFKDVAYTKFSDFPSLLLTLFSSVQLHQYALTPYSYQYAIHLSPYLDKAEKPIINRISTADSNIPLADLPLQYQEVLLYCKLDAYIRHIGNSTHNKQCLQDFANAYNQALELPRPESNTSIIPPWQYINLKKLSILINKIEQTLLTDRIFTVTTFGKSLSVYIAKEFQHFLTEVKKRRHFPHDNINDDDL